MWTHRRRRGQLLRVHDPAYVDAIEASVPVRGLVHLDPDTAMNPHSHRAACGPRGGGQGDRYGDER
jgi:acetoin utilization deacetylase AcuC-like enzyme